MARLIDADALKREINESGTDGTIANYVRGVLAATLDHAPTVDAEPVDGTPRVVTLDELINGAGVGYEENWLRGEDGEEDSFVLDECAWCKGGVVVNDSEYVSRAALERLYNRPYGLRVWSREPSAEQREKTPWAG